MHEEFRGLIIRNMKCLPVAVVALSAVLLGARSASAQAAAEPANPAGGQTSGTMRFYVELKDATLADALEMVFKAAGNPAHIIDDSAKDVNISASTFPNHSWDSIVRQLVNANGFKFYQNEARTWVIEPRASRIAPQGGEGGFGAEGGFAGAQGGFNRGGFTRGGQGGAPGAQGGFNQGGFNRGGQGGFNRGGQGGAVPANPFGGNRPEVRNFANPQTVPAFGGGTAAAGDDGEEKSFRLLTVKHVYVGGIAALFKDVGVIRSEPFVSPAFQGGGQGGQGGMGGGMMGGMGGMGGGMMGGMGGMGGGMMGGMGGMGGGMMGGMGGMGGMMGGMGGMGGFGGGNSFGGRGGFGRR